MIPEDKRERMHRSYYLDKKSLRQIAREERCSRKAVKKAVFDTPPKSYHLSQPRPTFVFGELFQARVVISMSVTRKFVTHWLKEFVVCKMCVGLYTDGNGVHF